MPTYEYRCEKCGHEFEADQKITAEPLKDCPAPGCCGKVARMIHGGGGFILKGTGWYATDYKKKPGEIKSGGSPSSESKPSKDVSPKPDSSGPAKDSKKS